LAHHSSAETVRRVPYRATERAAGRTLTAVRV
jgi:hypothetical protein